MQEIKAVHRVHRKPDGNPVRREFTLRTWQLLPTKTINGVTYPKMGYELESSVQNSFIPPESKVKVNEAVDTRPLVDRNIVDIKKFVKDNNLDVKTNQPKDDILDALKELGYA